MVKYVEICCPFMQKMSTIVWPFCSIIFFLCEYRRTTPNSQEHVVKSRELKKTDIKCQQKYFNKIFRKQN